MITPKSNFGRRKQLICATLVQRVLLFFCFSITFVSYSQSSEELVYGMMEFNHSALPTYSAADGVKYNDQSDLNHPDFGLMTFSKPYGKNVVEVLSKRTADERYYVDLDDPLFFYIQKSSKPINTYIDGYWRAIDPALRVSGEQSYYESGIQPVPTALDVENRHSVMELGSEKVSFNDYSLKITRNDGSIELYAANWSNIVVGNYETYITNIFPNIDFRMLYEEATVKSEFIVKEDMDAKELKFIDHLELGDNLGILIDEESETKGFVQIYRLDNGETQAVFRPALTFDWSPDHDDEWVSDYELNSTNLSIICDSIHLNNPSIEYPLVVDPTFTAVGPITSGFGLTGSLLSPSWCSNNLSVTFPGGSTPWDVSASWWVWTAGCSSSIFSCWMSEAQVYLTSSCGGPSPVGAPGTVWVCPGCNSPGSWNPTLPFNTSGTQSMAQCYTPMCVNQTMTFTINLNRVWCTGAAGSDNCTWATSFCQSMDQWQVTVQGRSVETLGNTATGNGTQTLNDPDCVGTFTLDPTELYGVAPYTYLWSTGETTGTIVVPVTPGVYTCTVTDACGTSVVATFTIGCPLDNEEMEFQVMAEEDYVRLDWMETATEIDHYIVERSGNSGIFQQLATIPAESITGIYRWYDENPLIGNNFYRIKLIHASGLEEYSPIEQVEMQVKEEELYLIPNPSTGIFSINLNSESPKPYQVIVRDVTGKELYRELLMNHDQMSIPEMADGVYLVEVYQNQTLIDQQRLILKR